MKINYRIKKSHKNWKNKAKIRSSENCELRKKIKRLEENICLEKMNHDVEVERLKGEIKNTLILANTKENNKKKSFGGSYQKIRVLCVQLLIVGVITFRAVPRILKIIGVSAELTHVPPHFTSVINWSLRSGIGIFQNVSPISEPWIAIIDMSNTIGTRKVLVVMRVLLNKLGQKGKAIDLVDSECVGIVSNDVWNGGTVKSALTEVFLKAGIPAAILKDGGGDLQKGVRLYCEEHKFKNIRVLDDVGHYAANALKAEFLNDPDFEKFIELITKGSSKIRQSIVAWALPPKLRTKGRFQGITKLAFWAQDMLSILDGHEDKISKKEMEVLLKTFSALTELRPFIEKFSTSCESVEQFLKIMKNKGLNEKTIAESKKILSEIPHQSIVKQRLWGWLVKHQGIQKAMGKQTLLVSTDIIESLFGKFKTIIQRSPTSELNRLIYLIPLLCGKRTEVEINQALLKCSHAQMLKFIFINIPTTIRQQRLKLLKKSKLGVPNLRNFIYKNAA